MKQKNDEIRIPDDAKYDDIEEYIRQKYSSYLKEDDRVGFPQQNDKENGYDVRKMAWYV